MATEAPLPPEPLGLLDAFAELPGYVWLVLAVGLSLGSIALSVWLLTELPADHLLRTPGQEPWTARRIGANLLGLVLVVLGALMALPGVPGQGLLTMACGLILLDIPGKRRLERRLFRLAAVKEAAQALRARHGKPPLLDPDASGPTQTG